MMAGGSRLPGGGGRPRRGPRWVGELLDLNADLERNASDTRFSGRSANVDFEGRNYYVFDENIFELFVQPQGHWTYCSNFYSPDWNKDKKESAHFSAQAALIAAEYLF